MSPGSRVTPLVRHARELGWRAYAIPVLVVITVWVLIDVFSAPTQQDSRDPGSVVLAGCTTSDDDADTIRHDFLRHRTQP